MRSTRELLDYILESRHELVRLYKGDDYPVLASPASLKEIANAEERAGFPFPPSYRAFLQVTNGIRDFADEIDMVSTKDIVGDEYADVIYRIREIGWRIGERLLIDGFIVGCRSAHRNVFVIDRSVEPDATGEIPVVYWSDSRLLTAPSFHEFLERWCDVSDQLLADARAKVHDMSAG
jgi:hypothetical protein